MKTIQEDKKTTFYILGSVRFLMFFKEVSYMLLKAALIWSKYIKNSTIVNYYNLK